MPASPQAHARPRRAASRNPSALSAQSVCVGPATVVTRDPELAGENAENLKLLLYLFDRDDAVRLMRAG